MNKKDLNEREVCSKFITPAILKAGWDLATQIREEVRFTKGRIIVRGKLVTLYPVDFFASIEVPREAAPAFAAAQS